MHEKLLRNLKDQQASKINHLKRGQAEDYTQYRELCAEIRILGTLIDELTRDSVEDDDE